MEEMKMYTKKITGIILAVAMTLMVASCGLANAGDNEVQTNLTGTADEVLEQILADLQESGVHMPMALPPTTVVGELSQNEIGLSTEDFDKLVDSAFSSMAAIATFAHQIIIIKATDAAAAAEIMKLVSGENGYDAHKWICVWPDSAVVIGSGEYVMIAVSNNEVVDAALAAFEAAAGNVSEPVRFFEHIDNGSDIDVGGGMGLITIG